MDWNDVFIRAGSNVEKMLITNRKCVCQETILCNSNGLYMTIESRITLNDPIHVFVVRYVRKMNGVTYMKTSRKFTIHISINPDTGELIFGINSQNDTIALDIILRISDLLKNMYKSEFDKLIKLECGYYGAENEG